MVKLPAVESEATPPPYRPPPGRVMTDDRPARLARIETTIAAHRSAYLHAYHDGRLDDADRERAEVDRLLQLWARVQRGPLTTTTA